jgi:hypothetical protein
MLVMGVKIQNFKKRPAKKYISFQLGINLGGKLTEFHPVFPFSGEPPLLATYIFTAP